MWVCGVCLGVCRGVFWLVRMSVSKWCAFLSGGCHGWLFDVDVFFVCIKSGAIDLCVSLCF